MPTVKHLLDELRKLDVAPEDVRIPATLYDHLVEQAQADEQADDEDED